MSLELVPSLRRVAPALLGALVSLLALVLVSGCVDTSPDRVKLTAEVSEVTLSVEEGLLVTSVRGAFQLVLSVGDLAGEPVTVEQPAFDLVTADDRTGLLRLDATATGTVFPVTLDEDESRALSFALTDGNTVEAAELPLLCAGPVRVSVTYRDSLADRPSLVESAPVTLSGCP